MLPNKPPFFYKCNSCGKTFSSKIKVNPILKFLNIKKITSPFLKCSHCGGRDVKFSSMNDLIKK